MAMEFEGKAVIVTGSSSGIGEAIAILFAKRGAMVTLCGRNEDRLKEAVKKCQQAGGGNKDRYISVCGDVNNKEVRERIVDKTVEKFGRLDVLVNNHGVASQAYSIELETEESYDSIMDTNLKSVYFMIQKAAPLLEKTGGNIVNISSIASTVVVPDGCVYSISKAAMDQMTRVLALQLAPKGIRLNAVNPTLVMTKMATENAGANTRERLEYISRGHPLHGRASTAEEQADAVVFLAGASAGFVTGQCLRVDGGASLLSHLAVKLGD